MSDTFANALGAALVAFIFTNLDDLLVLVLLFGECKVEDAKRQKQKQQVNMNVINSQLEADPESGSVAVPSLALPPSAAAADKSLRARHVLVGQYVGFSLLVLVSLAGFLAGSFLPGEYIGLLGIVPILIGVYKLYELIKDKCGENEEEEEEGENADEAQNPQIQARAQALGPSSAPERVSLTERQVRFHLDDEDSRNVMELPVSTPRLAAAAAAANQTEEAKMDSISDVEDHVTVDTVAPAAPETPTSRRLALRKAVLKVLSPQTAKVCGITLANGADNISIYLALFASASGSQIGITLAVFYFMLAIWLAVSWALLKVPPIARAIGHYGEYVVPWALMALGVYIMYEADCISLVS